MNFQDILSRPMEKALSRSAASLPVGSLLLLAAFLAGSAALLYGTTIFMGDLLPQAWLAGIGSLLALFWLVKRALVERRGLPRTGLEIPLVILLAGTFLSLIFSPAPRLGLERYAWLLLAVLLYYLLADLVDRPEARAGLRAALLTATAPAGLAAVFEVVARYQSWWERAGVTILPPFQVRITTAFLHPNTFMSAMNMLAPLALVMAWKAKRLPVKALSLLWLAMYALAVPFTSSRGGWLGTAAWVGVIALFWLAEGGRWRRWLHIWKQRPAVTSGVVLAALALAALAALEFYRIFAASDPTHGGGGNINREWMWAAALGLWRESPWLGTGLGRLGLELARVTRAFPMDFWPMHAHSTPVQILGESGLAGFVPFLLLVFSALRLFIRRLVEADAQERPWLAASLAAVASALAHGIFDDYTSFPALLALLAANAALLAATRRRENRFQRIPMAVLAVPGAAIIAVGLFHFWGYAPLYSMVSGSRINDWNQAARMAAESARRDPDLPYYQSQAGIAFAFAWSDSGLPVDLEVAREYMARAVELESTNSVNWANLSILSWQSGQPQQALQAIQRAIELGERAYSFRVISGWFFEQLHEPEMARDQYLAALTIHPGLASHPFWLATQLRREVAKETREFPVGKENHWQAAQRLITSGNLPLAQYELALSDIHREHIIANLSTWAALAIKEGDQSQILYSLDTMLSGIQEESLGSFAIGAYGFYYQRYGFPQAMVPGYLNVHQDTGQFDLLNKLVDLQIANGDCEAAAYTWNVLQRELRAGELTGQPYPPMPACVPASQGDAG